MRQLNEKPTFFGTAMLFLVPYALTAFIFFEFSITEWPMWGRAVFVGMITISLIWYAGRLRINRMINRSLGRFDEVLDRAKERSRARLHD